MAYRRGSWKVGGTGFASKPQRCATLQIVFETVEARRELGSTGRRDLLSALRTFSRITGRPLGEIPTEMRELRQLKKTVSPALHNISRGRWANVCSLVFKAVELAEEGDRADRQRYELSPQWAELLAPLPMKQVQIPLRPFARWCSAAGIEPCDVTQAAAEAYGHYLEEQSTRARPREAYCAMIRAWNKASEFNDQWPPSKIVLDTRYEHYALPWSTFPASFRDDVDAMIVDAMGTDLTASRTRRPIKPRMRGSSRSTSTNPMWANSEVVATCS